MSTETVWIKVYADDVIAPNGDTIHDGIVLLVMEATQSDDLLPCPFCGAAAEVENIDPFNNDRPIRYSVGCSDEECIGYQAMTTYTRTADAIAAWNRRSPHPLAKHMPSNEWLRAKIESDADLETEAGTMHPEAPIKPAVGGDKDIQ